jgi:solute carrier family 25 phosphate transporter 23/24/25/41
VTRENQRQQLADTVSSRGLTPNIIKVAPSIAVSFYTFETVRDTLVSMQDVPEPDEI